MDINSVWNLEADLRTNFILEFKPEIVTEFVKATIKTRPLSKSSLSEFAIAPRYYIEYLVGKKEEKDAWNLGKAVECLLLECKYNPKTKKWSKSKFDKTFFISNKPNLRTKDGKTEWLRLQEHAIQNELILISQDMFDQAELMAINTLSNPNCKMWLDKKQNIQKKLKWTDKKTGLPVIGYIDFEAEFDEHITIIDNKQSKCKTPDEFFKDVYKFRYDLQIGSYLTAYHKLWYQFPDFMFMISTNEFPYDSYMVHVPGDVATAAKDEFQYMLTAFKYCLDNNQFHMGVDFWLFDNMPYHSLVKPRWIKSKIINE